MPSGTNATHLCPKRIGRVEQEGLQQPLHEARRSVGHGTEPGSYCRVVNPTRLDLLRLQQ